MTEPLASTRTDPVAQYRQAPESQGIRAFGAIASALLLYALLADAAVETFASGSSVRWWAAGIVAAYAAATVALWRRAPRLWGRFGWRNRAAASFFVLLGLLAYTAWLPGGQAAGVTVAAQPTSTLFAAVAAAAVVLSTLVLLRALKTTPLWVRAAVGALATYSLSALAIGIARHTPYSELLRGASVWTRAPFWLQGAFLGAVVVVPVAVGAELIAIGRRMAAKGAWSGEMGRAVALALSALMAAPALTLPQSAHGIAVAGTAARFAFADAGQLERAAAARLVDEPPGMPAETDPAHLLDAAGGVVRRFRPEEWEVDALAASLGKDPAAAFEFVRDAIAFDPYAGVLRGAEGTLAARAGNAWDRALLLRALLAKSGFKTRLAFATLDGAMATRLVQRAHQRPARGLSGAAPAGLLTNVIAAVEARARRDDAALRLALGARLNELGVEEAEVPRQDVARHAWVQLLNGDAWIDLDPTLANAQMGKALAAASGTAEDVPPEQLHAVVVRVIAKTLAGGKLSETVTLERKLPAATAAGQYLLLAFLPEEGKGGGRLMGGAAPPTSFVPTLCVGDETQTGRTIETTVTGGGAGFDSLFGGEDASARELAGLFIEVETRAPGRRPTVARHVLLDRGPSDALKPMAPHGAVPRALRGFHHLMISTGGTSPFDMARLRLSVLKGTLGSDGVATQQARPGSPAWPFWGSDLTLVEGSEQVVVRALDSTARGRAYVDEPRVFLGSWFPEPNSADGLSRETDLLIDSIRVLLPEPASAREMADRQLQYGVLESALETETTLRLAAAWDPAGRTVVSTSLAMSSRLTVLAPSDVERLPARSAGALRTALRGGELAVVPGDVAAATAWWTVARSGFVRAIVEPGAGMSTIIPPVTATRQGTFSGGKDSGKRGGSGTEYTTINNEVAKKTTQAASRVGYSNASTFEGADPTKAAKLAKLLGR